MLKKLLFFLLPVMVLLGGCSAAQGKAGSAQTVSFPANQEGKDEYNAAIYDTEPFTLSVELPEGWTLGTAKEKGSAVGPDGLLYTPVGIFREGEQVGTVGFNIYEEAEGVPPEQYYQVVYSAIRLGSVAFWNVDPYQPLCQTDNGETTLATVCYKDPEQMTEGKSAAEVPYIEEQGILSYDRERRVYVGFHFTETIEQDELEAIAKSIAIA